AHIEGTMHVMMMSKLRSITTNLLNAVLLLGSAGLLGCHVTAAKRGDPPKVLAKEAAPGEALTVDTFAVYYKQIRPQEGESRWLEIPWYLDLHEARQKAAAEGKPLFVYSGGGATGIGPC